MGDKQSPTMESQVESIHLSPQRQQLQHQHLHQTIDVEEQDGNITQADLDRYGKVGNGELSRDHRRCGVLK